MRVSALALAVSLLATSAVLAQAPPAAVPTAAPAATPAAPAPAVKAAKPKKCMRLPLSDIAFGEKETIAQARMRLDEYAAAEAQKRGWGNAKLAKSLETASCEVYLVLPFAGTEYKCLVTTTFCTN